MVVIKIAIIENEEYYVKELYGILKRWEAEEQEGCEINVVPYKDGETFLNSKMEEYHIVFMDIELDGKMNGIETAERMRKKEIGVPIVFLTSYKEFVWNGYKVRALDYIIKPINFEQVKWCMDEVWESVSDGFYFVRYKDENCAVRYNEIIYFESSLHYVDINTVGRKYRQMITMKKLKQFLPKQFKQCHRTIIVNINHIHSLHAKEINITGDIKLPVSSSYAEELRRAYLGRTHA